MKEFLSPTEKIDMTINENKETEMKTEHIEGERRSKTIELNISCDSDSTIIIEEVPQNSPHISTEHKKICIRLTVISKQEGESEKDFKREVEIKQIHRRSRGQEIMVDGQSVWVGPLD